MKMRFLFPVLLGLLILRADAVFAAGVESAEAKRKKAQEEAKKKAEEEAKKKEREKAEKEEKRRQKEEEAKKAAEERKRLEEERQKEAEEAKKGGGESSGISRPGTSAEPEDKASIEAEAARAKNRWIDAEIEFIAKLADKDYDTIAKELLDQLMAGKTEPGQEEPLSPEQKLYMRRGEVRMLTERIRRLREAKEKVESINRATTVMKEIIASLPDKSPMQQEAKQDYVELCFKIAGNLVDDYQRSGNADLKTVAESLFEEGSKLAGPIQEDYDNRFGDAIMAYEEATNPAYKKRAEKKAVALLINRTKFQHICEAAYAQWPLLHERGSARRKELVKKGMEYIESVIYDYENYLPDDKQVYIHWMRLLGQDDDPIFDEEAKDRYMQFDKEQEKEAKEAREKDPFYYLWYSDRMRFLFNRQFVRPLQGKPSEEQKVKALYIYAEGLLGHLRGAWDNAQKSAGDKQKKWFERVEELLPLCQNAMDDIVRPRSAAINCPIDPTTNAAANLYLKSEYHLFRLTYALGKKEPDRKAAEAEMMNALNAVSAAATLRPDWQKLTQERLVALRKKAEELNIAVENNVGLLMASADQRYDECVRLRDLQKQKALAREVMGLYLKVLDAVKKGMDREQRVSYLPRLLDRLSTCANWVDDYYRGYLFSFELVQQFPPARYPWQKYPQLESPIKRNLKNVLYFANRLTKAESLLAHRELYAEALLLNLYAQGEAAPPELTPQLIEQFKQMGNFTMALDLVNNTPKSHPYKRTIMLQGADVCQRAVKVCQQEIKKIVGDGEAEKARRAALEEEKKRWEADTLRYACL
ncbi:MAG: hypothetical protein N3A66_03700, partial [Planctomycetota bacterium]|nr:hypothetical protein [Planctomycetota bacterium]